MFMKTVLVCLSLLLFSGAATAAHLSQKASDGCNRRMRSQARKFSAQVRRNLAEVTGFPLVADWIDPKAANLIASALNVRPEDVDLLYSHPAKVRLVENSRLQLELENWPHFQRTLISLKQPAVVQDLALAAEPFEPSDSTTLSLALQSSTRLFYAVKDLGRDMQLGFVMPTRDVMLTGAELPYYEIQLSLLKPCLDAEICVDDLVRFTTWPDEHF
jgi:hypothetical protein